jgi:hypothetical protein
MRRIHAAFPCGAWERDISVTSTYKEVPKTLLSICDNSTSETGF